MCKMGYCSGLQHTYNFYWLTAIYGTYVQYYVVEGFGRHARISYEAGQQPPTRIYFSARIIINATEKILRMIYFQPATRQSTTRAHFPSIAFCTCNIWTTEKYYDRQCARQINNARTLPVDRIMYVHNLNNRNILRSPTRWRFSSIAFCTCKIWTTKKYYARRLSPIQNNRVVYLKKLNNRNPRTRQAWNRKPRAIIWKLNYDDITSSCGFCLDYGSFLLRYKARNLPYRVQNLLDLTMAYGSSSWRVETRYCRIQH